MLYSKLHQLQANIDRVFTLCQSLRISGVHTQSCMSSTTFMMEEKVSLLASLVASFLRASSLSPFRKEMTVCWTRQQEEGGGGGGGGLGW